MEQLLNSSQDLDVDQLDQMVTTFYTGSGPQQQMAQQILTQFQEDPESWLKVDAILSQSKNTQTKYLALQILEKLIQTRWKVLPHEQRMGIRNFIVNIIIATSENEQSLRKEKTYLNKLNLILVQILKQEWPHNWPQFIPELVNTARANLNICENNMAILKLLSEEIFDYSAEQMTQSKTKNLKTQMCNEFSSIFELCNEVLEKAQQANLITATLETLLRFLNWIPLGYIFETNVIDNLRIRFLQTTEFRNVTLKCLTEIGALSVGNEYNDKFITLFTMVVQSVAAMIPPDADIPAVYMRSSNEEQEFIQNLALFYTSFLGAHLKILETDQTREALNMAHWYLLKITQIDEREVFKVCLEYWTKMVGDLFEESRQQMPVLEMPLLTLSPSIATSPPPYNNVPKRKYLYSDLLSNLRVVMINSMVKPEEVLVVENEEGEVVREFMKDCDAIVLYKSMRECLVYLTHLDLANTEVIMTDKLNKQVDGTEWSWNNLNKLCWSIGSISGAMSEDTEKRFLVTVIKELLGLCEAKRGKDNKAIVASNIMYVVGQYPRFLKAHWKFLKTVVNKLFEFMHETHEGVQDMACDTFMKIAQKCRRQFVIQQQGEQCPFIDEILSTIDRITSDLSFQQVQTFFEAVGYMIAAQQVPKIQEHLVMRFMDLPNTTWDRIMTETSADINTLANMNTVKLLGHLLKVNVAACSSIGSGFYPQLARIYQQLLDLYGFVSRLISQAVAREGVISTKTPRIRGYRVIKKETLKLVETYVQKAENLHQVMSNIIPALMQTVLVDYNTNVEQARDAEVLSIMATVVLRLENLITAEVPGILNAVFECTLNMINKDLSEYPEHRVAFFKLLRAIDQSCFPALLNLPPAQFKLVIDSIIWAFKHTMRDIADTGLQICLELLNNIANINQNTANAFYQQYFLNLLQDVFFVLTDTDHKSGFKGQALVLSRMFFLVESGAVQAPLFSPAEIQDPAIDNQQFLREYVMRLLKNAFPHLHDGQIRHFVLGLFELNQDFTKFKLHLRDFLIQLKEFSGDNADLYIDEREAEQERLKQLERDQALKVPGLIKPADLPMDEE